MTFIWFVIDAGTHLTMELAFLIMALGEGAEKTDSYWGFMWRLYAKADARWAVNDPGLISIEVATVFMGLLCLVQLYALWNRSSYRHVLQLFICTAELYGGWMTFGPEWFSTPPNPNLAGMDEPVLFWIYLVFMNGLWVVVPAVLLWESWVFLSHITSAASPKMSASAEGKVPKSAWLMTAGFLVTYAILVPLVLMQAEDVPVKV